MPVVLECGVSPAPRTGRTGSNCPLTQREIGQFRIVFSSSSTHLPKRTHAPASTIQVVQFRDARLQPELFKMDLAYDHITEDSYKEGDKSKAETKDDSKPEQPQASLSADVQDAYKAFSNSPWGAKLGGFFGTVKKQVRIVRLYRCHEVRGLINIQSGRGLIHPSFERVFRGRRGRAKRFQCAAHPYSRHLSEYGTARN